MIAVKIAWGAARWGLSRAAAGILPALGYLPALPGLLALLAGSWLAFQALEAFGRWRNPPPPMVSVDAVRAEQERQRREQAEADAARIAAALSEREADLAEAAEEMLRLQDEMRQSREQTIGRDSVVLPPDDGWLRQWQQRAP